MLQTTTPTQLELDQQLLEQLGEFAYDPYAWVMWAFPWGEEGSELAKETGPDDWQTQILCAIRDDLITLETAMLIAVSSGHGVGKSALVSWLVWWAYSTYPGTRGVVTANTENQLKTKTWVEIAKWHRLFLAKHLFKCTATAIFSVDEELAREWRIDIVPWSERNTEAFAGLHNAGKRILIVYDEASAIPDIIWETTEGAMTDEDTEIIWVAFGNPTRDKGRFRECFKGGKFAHRWYQMQVDSRSVKRTNKKKLAEWIADYGLDSDFVKVRVLGKFPSGSMMSFINYDDAKLAARRPIPHEILTNNTKNTILGVDVARYGEDLSVLWARRGLDARSIPPIFFERNAIDTLAHQVIRYYNQWDCAAAMIDGTGMGAGVVDICRSSGIRVFEVNFGAGADGFDPDALYMNKRAEIWGLMRKWLGTGFIPEKIGGVEIPAELALPEYTINVKGKIQLESKEMIMRRGEKSPNFADALACTFAYPLDSGKYSANNTKPPQSDYDPHEEHEKWSANHQSAAQNSLMRSVLPCPPRLHRPERQRARATGSSRQSRQPASTLLRAA